MIYKSHTEVKNFKYFSRRKNYFFWLAIIHSGRYGNVDYIKYSKEYHEKINCLYTDYLNKNHVACNK